MIRCWLALTYYLYALRLAALSHFYFNRLYQSLEQRMAQKCTKNGDFAKVSGCLLCQKLRQCAAADFGMGAGSLKALPAAPLGKLPFGAGNGGIQQGAAVCGLCGRGKPDAAVFRALAFVGGDGKSGFMFGQAA